MSSAPTPLLVPVALAHLREERNVAADTAVALALPHMAAPAQAAALQLLVERGRQESLAQVVAGFVRYDPPLQSLVLANLRGLFGGVRRAIGSPEYADRAAAIELIRRSRDGHLMDLLADSLRARCVRTRELAAQVLHELAEELLHRGTEGSDLGSDAGRATLAEGLAHALRRAIATWEIHLQPRILEAALWMGDLVEPAIRKRLSERQCKLAWALQHVLEGLRDPRLAGFALRALSFPALRPSAARAIGRASDPAFVRALLRECWLLADLEIEHGCRWLRDVQWLEAVADGRATLTAEEAAGAVRLIACAGGSVESKVERFRRLVAEDAPELRCAVVWQLVEMEADCAGDLVRTISGRTGDDAGRIAEREQRRRRLNDEGASAGPPLPADTSPAGRAWRAFERYWEEYAELEVEDRQALTEAMCPLAAELLVPIRARLASSTARDRARALAIVRDFGLTATMAEQVYQHAHDPDPVVRSLAVALLAGLPGPTSARILRGAVNDVDERVQANAVEALDRLDAADRAACTLPKLDSANARLRANAVKSLLRLEAGRAVEALLGMLTDPQPAHRLSALWVVERLHLRAVVGRLLDLRGSDPDGRVRRRAARVLETLPVETKPQQRDAGPERHGFPIGGPA